MPANLQPAPAPQSTPPCSETTRIACLSEAQARFDRVAAAALERRLAS